MRCLIILFLMAGTCAAMQDHRIEISQDFEKISSPLGPKILKTLMLAGSFYVTWQLLQSYEESDVCTRDSADNTNIIADFFQRLALWVGTPHHLGEL